MIEKKNALWVRIYRDPTPPSFIEVICIGVMFRVV